MLNTAAPYYSKRISFVTNRTRWNARLPRQCQLSEPGPDVSIHIYSPIPLPLYVTVTKLHLMYGRRENPCLCQLLGPFTSHITDKYLEASGPGSSDGIATAYGLNSPGIKSRWGLDFPYLSRPALDPTQPPAQWVPCLSRG